MTFRVNQDSTKFFFFFAEVLHTRSTFSSRLAVLQIRRMSECLVTPKKSWIFIFHLYKALQCSVKKNLIFWLETKVERLVDLPFNAIKVHLVAVFVFFVTAASFIEIIFS